MISLFRSLPTIRIVNVARGASCCSEGMSSGECRLKRFFNQFRHKPASTAAQRHFSRLKLRRHTEELVMVAITSPVTTTAAENHNRLLGEIWAFWRHFIVATFNPYRPEQHYMRGPGPAWRAKYGKAHRHTHS
jgi:hypothetical protein